MPDAPKPDAASILFPNDVAPAKAPEYFRVERDQAAARLAGLGNLSKPADAPKPDVASQLFPSDAKQDSKTDTRVAASANEKKSDFPEDPARGYEKTGSSFDALRLHAISDGEKDRAEELRVARDGLIANARDAGTPSEELEAAMDIVRERSGAGFEPPTIESVEAERDANLEVLRTELGDTFEADISIARKLIADVERIAPGTIASLEHSGAGNDIRLIRSVIREAKRRGYR